MEQFLFKDAWTCRIQTL